LNRKKSELKHLSNSKKKINRDFVSSGERTQKRLKKKTKKLKKCKSHFSFNFLSKMEYVSLFLNTGEPPSKPKINVSDSEKVL